MAVTITQLTSYFTNANAGTAPTASQLAGLQGILAENATLTLTDAQALQKAIDMGSDTTTAVSVQTYQYFLGFAPSQAGLAALNAAYVGSGSQVLFNGENRFIAQSVSLAMQNATAKAAFSAKVGALSYADAATLIYNEVVGATAAAAAGINVANAVSFLTSASAIAYYTAFVRANAGLGASPSAADVDLAVKAALVGAIMNAATAFNGGAGVGSYATATNNLIKDLADDGVLVSNNVAGIDLFGKYATPAAPKALSLTTGIDALVGGDGNDTITGLFAEGTNPDVSTLSTFDTIDGGAGTDTLNLYISGKGSNNALPTNASIKNVEIVNLYADASPAAALANASTYGAALTQLWQIGSESDVTNLAAGQTAGFRNTTGTLEVYTAAAAATASVALDGVNEGVTLFVGDESAETALAAVTISGSVKDSNDDGSVAAINAVVGLGKNVTAVTVNSAVATTLTVNDNTNNTGGATLRTVDASASAGAISFSAGSGVRTITTGAGADTVTVTTATVIDDTATTADETVSASVTTGAGKDTVTVNTSGTGATTVSTGDDADTITINGAGSNTLTVNAGAGDDTVVLGNDTTVSWSSSSTGVKDVVSGGDGTDTLSMTAAIATSVSAGTTFERAIDGFERVSVGAVGASENATVNLANLDDISYVVTNGGSFTAGVTESHVVTFTSLLSGQSVTVGGATYTNNTGATLTASQVATNFAAAYDLAGYGENLAGNVITYTASTANTNTANISASVANSAAATAPSIATTQGVSPIVATSETSAVTFQGLIAGESTTVAGRIVTATAVTETVAVTFGALNDGQTLTVNGVTVTATGGNLTAAQVASAFASATTAGDAVVTGSQSSLYTASAAGNVVTYTATTAGANVTDIAITGANAGTATLGTITQGNNGNLTATQVATAFSSGTSSGGAVVSGALAGFTAGAVSGQSVTFTASTTGNVTDITVSSTSGTQPTVSTTQGINAVAGTTENGTVTFSSLRDGQSVTVAGRTVTATGQDLTAAQIADAFAAGATSGAAVVSGTLSADWTVANGTAGDAVVNFTSATATTNVTDFPAGTVTAAAAPTAPGVVSTQGSEAFGNLTLNNLAAAGTVELRATNAGTVTVNLADATGSSDVVNVRINGTSNVSNPNGGTVVVAGVETINITTADRTSNADPSAASKPNLVAADAVTVTVTGNHGVDFTGSTLSALATLDASGVVSTRTTGAATAAAVTFTAAASTSKTLSVTTGMGNDVINLSANTKGGATLTSGAGDDTLTGTASASAGDTINAGDGNDVVNSSAGADTITLGAGKDSYKLGSSAHSLLAVGDTITDFSANTAAQTTASLGANTNIVVRTGDVIDVSGRFGGGVTGIKVGIATNAADAQTQLENISTNDGTLTGFVLDSSTGKLYMDFDDNGTVDSVITLTGVTTLTTAAFLTGLGA